MNQNWDMKTGEKVKILLSLTAIAFVTVIGGCSALNNYAGLPQDNELEELVEQVIDQYTGLDLDLSADSPEQ